MTSLEYFQRAMALLIKYLSSQIVKKNNKKPIYLCRNFCFQQTQQLAHFSVSFFIKCHVFPKVSSNKIGLNFIAPTRNISLFSIGMGLRKLDVGKIIRQLLLRESALLRRRGCIWYSTFEGISIKEFITLLHMPDTFVSWLKVIQLHIWILLVRLYQDGEEFRTVRTSLIRAMWDDIEERARDFAPKNINKKQNFKIFYREFTTILFAYDEAFLTNDKALYSVLWYYFFDCKCDDPRNIETLISYIRHQINHLQQLNTKNMKETQISKDIWTPLHSHLKC